MLKRFRSLCQDDQIRLLAIADALAPAMLQDEMECRDESGDDKTKYKIRVFTQELDADVKKQSKL